MSEKKGIEYPIEDPMKDVAENRCPILYAMDIIGQKWKLPILWHLHNGSIRYNELKRKVTGITNIMLTKSLRELEETGLVKREVYDTVPPKVEYSLTENGENLLPTLNELYKWGQQQMNSDLQKKSS
jgi:DNA-binding HxlR family transcriptional regulator